MASGVLSALRAVGDVTKTSGDADISVGTDNASLDITDDDTATVSIAKVNDGAETDTPTDGKFRVTQTAASSTDTVLSYTVGHEFVPPPIHSGGLRYHGCAPMIGLLRSEGILEARAYRQAEVFEAGTQFTRLQGLLPAPETCHAIRAAIDVALECRSTNEEAVIVFCFSGNGLLDLEAYGLFNGGQLDGDRALGATPWRGED